MDSKAQPISDSVFSHPGYVHLTVSRVVTALATQAMTIALGWLIYDLTQSAFALGFVGFCQFLPRFFLTLIVGQIADHFDRRIIVLICQALQAPLRSFWRLRCSRAG